jgi:predicted kinase
MIDATNVDPKARKDWIKIGRAADAYIETVSFEVPMEELIRRDAQRDRHVGPEVIEKFVKRYQRPTKDEVDAHKII